MVDYSKWDKYAANLSDDDDDNISSVCPHVTKVEDGSKVIIGPEGTLVQSSLSRAETPCNSLEKTSKASEADWCRNGAVTERFFWSQSRHEVFLRIKARVELKSKDVRLSLSSDRKYLKVYDEGRSHTIVEGSLKYPIEFKEDQDELDWELHNYNEVHRIILLTLIKHSPIAGATIWWSQVFKDDDVEIDVTAIEDRKMLKGSSSNNTWDEAHRMFVESVKALSPTSISLDDESDD